jgi:hypothetical protein
MHVFIRARLVLLLLEVERSGHSPVLRGSPRADGVGPRRRIASDRASTHHRTLESDRLRRGAALRSSNMHRKRVRARACVLSVC